MPTTTRAVPGARQDAAAPRTVLACGEVRTCLLPAGQALDSRAAAQLLRLRADERVLVSERPNLYGRSPDTLTGVDCPLPSAGAAPVSAPSARSPHGPRSPRGACSRPRRTSPSPPPAPTTAAPGATTWCGPDWSSRWGNCRTTRSPPDCSTADATATWTWD